MSYLNNTETQDPPDPHMVEAMANAAAQAMEHTAIPDITTPAEVLSAAFTLLDRTLRGIRRFQSPEDQAANAKEIARVLHEMLIDFGSLPN